MNPFIVGSAISAASQLAPALFGKKGPSINQQMDRQYMAMASAARKFGVSKLVTFGGGIPQPGAAMSVGGDLGQSLANMGQDIGRAVASGQTASERALTALALDKAALENEFLRTQIGGMKLRVMRESAPPLPDKPGLIPTRKVLPQQTKGVNFLGMPITSNPYSSDANSLEDRYGELGGSLLGLPNIAADVFYSLLKRWFGSTGNPKRYLNTGIRGGR